MNSCAKVFLIAVMTTGLFAGSAGASTIYTWTGAVDGDWENAANWDANGVPVDAQGRTTELSFENSNPDRIVINATNHSPSNNVPRLYPYHVNGEVTPTVDVLNGHVAFDITSDRPGSGHTELNDHTFTTIGDGDVGTGLASLTYNNPGQFRRGGNFVMSVTVNSDGSFIFGSGTTLARTGALQVTLAGGSTTFMDWVRPQHGNGDPGDPTGNSWFDFTAVGATFTAGFGSIFEDIDWVNYYIDEGEFFRNSTGLPLVATDNNDNTFTVTAIPEPGAVGLMAIFAAAAILRRRLRK